MKTFVIKNGGFAAGMRRAADKTTAEKNVKTLCKTGKIKRCVDNKIAGTYTRLRNWRAASCTGTHGKKGWSA
jgi:hypothetical protein